MMDSGHSYDDPSYLGRRDRWRGVFVLFMSITASILLILWSKEQVRLRTPEGATIRSLQGIVGWPERIDVLASLAGASRRSSIKELGGIVAEGVGWGGTVNLKTGDHSIKYVFQRPPVGGSAKVAVSNRKPTKNKDAALWGLCAKQSVKLRRKGLTREEERLESRCLLELSAPLPPPACGPKEVWERAVKKGAPRDALARLDYFRSKAGPAWKLLLPGKRFQLFLTGDCKRELLPSETQGKVP